MSKWTTYWEAHYQLLRKVFHADSWEDHGIQKKSCPKALDYRDLHLAMLPETVMDRRGHIHWMISQLPDMVQAGHSDKAQRWLGFLHGYAVCTGHISLMDLMDRCRLIEDSFAQSISQEKDPYNKGKEYNLEVSITETETFQRNVKAFAALYNLYQKSINSVAHLTKENRILTRAFFKAQRDEFKAKTRLHDLDNEWKDDQRKLAQRNAEQRATIQGLQADLRDLERSHKKLIDTMSVYAEYSGTVSRAPARQAMETEQKRYRHL